jgi:hypothetical protein
MRGPNIHNKTDALSTRPSSDFELDIASLDFLRTLSIRILWIAIFPCDASNASLIARTSSLGRSFQLAGTMALLWRLFRYERADDVSPEE